MKHYLILTAALIGFYGVFVNAHTRAVSELAAGLRENDKALAAPGKP